MFKKTWFSRFYMIRLHWSIVSTIFGLPKSTNVYGRHRFKTFMFLSNKQRVWRRLIFKVCNVWPLAIVKKLPYYRELTQKIVFKHVAKKYKNMFFQNQYRCATCWHRLRRKLAHLRVWAQQIGRPMCLSSKKTSKTHVKKPDLFDLGVWFSWNELWYGHMGHSTVTS